MSSEALRAAARTLHDALADPDSVPGTVRGWHAAYDAMRDDHAENMEIGGEADWPSTLLAALRALAETTGKKEEGR